MEKFSLNGEWALKGAKVECKTIIPGDFHSSLEKNGIISNPFEGFNEQNQLWVGQTDWTIYRNFEISCKDDNAFYILELCQADTFFNVFINDILIGSGQNEFARYRFDISKSLKAGNNEIKIVFDSPENKAIELSKKLEYPIPYSQFDVCSPHRNLVRKCQCNGGWDWGPCVMVSGIYSDINIFKTKTGIFDSLTVSYDKKQNNIWTLHAQSVFDSFSKEGQCQVFVFELNQNEKTPVKKQVSKEIVFGKNKIEVEIQVENPYLWKTSTELKQLELKQNEISTLTCNLQEEPVSISKKVCFNNLKTVSQSDFANGQKGRSLYFENNGIPLFSKGSNWIPCDIYPSRMTYERYYQLLSSAADANINTIRVWGGGIYENEAFYDICDLLGLIVWQDCMFACSVYPATKEFLQNVSEELEYQIPRLQSHACIGLWCGNNENFGALNWYPETRENKVRYLFDYDRLYNNVIANAVKNLDPSRMFWPSSPCAGPNDYGDNWHSDNQGDMHFWSVWHEKMSFSAYQSIQPRFVSEFGYESFPSLDTIGTFAKESDYNFTSPLMEYHQRSPIGNTIILENFSRYFRFPSNFESMVYLSQVQQALAIKTAVSYWRALKPHCMGSIIWQLNDIWPGPSWSSLEYSGKWKLLHYEMQKFYSDVFVSLFIQDGKLNVSVCNDLKSNINGTLKINYYDFDGKEFYEQKSISLKLSKDTTKTVFEQELITKDIDKYFIYASFDYTADNKAYSTSNTIFADLYKHCSIQEPELSYTVDYNKQNGCFDVMLESEKPAFFVSLDTTNIKGRFSTNMITLLPGKKQKITFTPEKEYSIKEFKDNLFIKDLSCCN